MGARAIIRSALILTVLATRTHAAGEPTVIELTQTGCQFLEPEKGIDHGYRPQSKADCESINDGTALERLAASQILRLEPGHYIFRVTNKDVPYVLGFWLRGDGVIARATLPSTSGGKLTPGTTRDYPIELTPGTYVYSCPLNPTPDYRLLVGD